MLIHRESTQNIKTNKRFVLSVLEPTIIKLRIAIEMAMAKASKSTVYIKKN